MTDPNLAPRSFGPGAALLVGIALATLIAAECVWLAILFGGAHHAALLRDPDHLVPLWLLYTAAFAVPALLGWLAARGTARRDERLAPAFLVLLPCVAPVINGALATRTALQTALMTPWGASAAIATTALGAAWLIWVARPGRERAGWATLAALIWAPQALCATNVISVFRPPQEFLAPRGLALLGVTWAAAALLSVPLFTALRGPWSTGRGRRLVAALGVSALVLLLPIWATPSPSAEPGELRANAAGTPPSVLLIVIDTLRADALAGFGGDPNATPNAAVLARDSSVFTRAYAAAPWTTPSFGSILTSNYPSSHQAGRRDPVLDFKYALDESLPTLAEVLRSRGYWTGAALSNGYLTRRMGLDRGFDDYENLVSIQWRHPVVVGLAARGLAAMPAYVPAAAQTGRILEIVRRGVASGRPFFVLAHYMDPHTPNDVAKGAEPHRDADAAELYRDEVAYTDRHLGVLIGELRAMGLYDDLLIVLTADHGEELTEARGAGNHGHGHTLFDEVLHVPLLVKQPGGAGAGDRYAQPVSGIDVAPTILELVGIEQPVEFEGHALLGRDARLDADRILFAEGMLHGREQKAAISGDVKVIFALNRGNAVRAHAYDRGRDPGETHPLEADSARFEPLASALARFSESSGPRHTVRVEFDDLDRRRLEALGYSE